MDYSYLFHPGFLNLGAPEIVIILLVAVLLFGGRLPEIARTVGKQFYDTKRKLKDLQNDIYRQDIEPPTRLPQPYEDRVVGAERLETPESTHRPPEVPDTGEYAPGPAGSETGPETDAEVQAPEEPALEEEEKPSPPMEEPSTEESPSEEQEKKE